MINAALNLHAVKINISNNSHLQELFSTANATYVITKHINLNGATINLPANCKLQFKGGSLFNGKLNGQIKNKNIDITYLGASTDNAQFNSEAIENASNICKTVVIPHGIYIVTRTINIGKDGISIIGSKDSQLKSRTTMNIIHTTPNIKDFAIKNLYLNGVGSNTTPSYLLDVDHNAKGILVQNCTFDGGTGGILINYEGENVTIKGCTFRNMVYIPGAGLALTQGPKAGGAGGYGIVFQQIQNKHKGITNASITGCTFESTVIRHAMYIQSSDNIVIKKNTIYGTNEMNDSQLMEDLLSKGLTAEQLRQMDIRKHMTIYDLPLNFRGCTNIVVQQNTINGGLGFINGTPDYKNNLGSNFKILENKITNVTPKGGLKILNTNFAQDIKLKKNQ